MPVKPKTDGGASSISDYVQRQICNDADLISLRAVCSRWRFDLLVPLTFRPASFTCDQVEKYHTALSQLQFCPRDLLQPTLDHLWLSEPESRLPLLVRMARRRNPDLGGPTYAPDAQAIESQHQLESGRLAALRRDKLFSELATSLAEGQMVCTGFLAVDVARKRVTIPSEWWEDRIMICDWRADELHSKEKGEGPHYRGIQIGAQKNTPNVVLRSAKTGPKAAKPTLQNARKELASKLKFRDKTEEYHAVLKHLGITGDTPRGFSYKSFVKLGPWDE